MRLQCPFTRGLFTGCKRTMCELWLAGIDDSTENTGTCSIKMIPLYLFGIFSAMQDFETVEDNNNTNTKESE